MMWTEEERATIREALETVRQQYLLNTSPILNRESEIEFWWNKVTKIDVALDKLDHPAPQGEWQPVKRSDLTDFLEQGALVEADEYTLSVYRNGVGAQVDLPENIRLCQRRTPPDAPAQPPQGDARARYSHRNGETEPPTQTGTFWFSSAAIIGSDVFRWQDQFELERNNGRLGCCYDRENGAWIDVTNMVGQWWGPIVAPWGQTQQAEGGSQ